MLETCVGGCAFVIIFTASVPRQIQSIDCSVRGTYVVALHFSLVILLLASPSGNGGVSFQFNVPPPMTVQPYLAKIS